MQTTTTVLLSTAASIGFVHTLIGVDHSLPFVVLARAQRWTLAKLLWVTALCGTLHVASSVVIGMLGVALGIALGKLQWLQETRGSWAARLLIAFGLAYAIWGWVQLRRNKHHSHVHAHEDGTVHDHNHNHHGEHVHAHAARNRAVTVASLMLLFVLGPCEALVPLLVAPAYDGNWAVAGSVVGVFGATTLGVMMLLVTVGHYGLRWSGFKGLERYMHVLAGSAIMISGLAVELLGI